MALNTITVQANIGNSQTGSGANAVNGMFINRTVVNLSGMDIGAIMPIVNAGWDTGQGCMSVRLPNSMNDVVMGITLDGINNGCTKVIRYVSTGLITGIDTSAWEFNEMLYSKTDGTLTNDPTQENVIPQEIAIVLRKDAAQGEIYVATVGTQVKYMQLTVSILAAKNADTGSGRPGEKFVIKGGKGDGAGAGGDIELVPGVKGAGSIDGSVIVKQPGTEKAAGKYFSLWHDGVNAFFRAFTGFFNFWNKIVVKASDDTDGTKQVEVGHDGINGKIESKSGKLTTTNTFQADRLQATGTGDNYVNGRLGVGREPNYPFHVEKDTAGDYLAKFENLNDSDGRGLCIYVANSNGPVLVIQNPLGQHLRVEGDGSVNIPILKSPNIVAQNINLSNIVETDSDGMLIGAEKSSAYNKNFGTVVGTVCEGNDSRLRNFHESESSPSAAVGELWFNPALQKVSILTNWGWKELN